MFIDMINRKRCTSGIKETANDIKKDAEKILDMIEDIEKKGRKK